MVYYVVNVLAIALNGAFVVAFLTLLNKWVPLVAEVHKKLPMLPEKYVIMAIVVVSMGLFVVIGLSPVVDSMIRYVKGYREMLRDERDLFRHAYREVLSETGRLEMGRTGRATGEEEKYEVYVKDSPEMETEHLGMDSFAVSRKLLKNLTPDEIKAALAHEVAHLRMGHGIQVRVFFSVNVLGQIALLLTKRLVLFFSNLSELELPIVSWLGVFGYIGVNLLRIMIEVLLVFPLLIGAIIGFRQNEYAADRFVVSLGFGEGLHSYLIRQLDEQEGMAVGGNILERFLRWTRNLIYPSPGKRLVEIEKIL